MFRYLMLAALTGVLFLTTVTTVAASTIPASDRATASLLTSGPVVFDDGPGLGGGY